MVCIDLPGKVPSRRGLVSLATLEYEERGEGVLWWLSTVKITIIYNFCGRECYIDKQIERVIIVQNCY